MPDIFISYSRKDSEQALELAERMRAQRVDVWLDTASLAAAETWSAEIVNAINSCSVLVVLLSPHSVASVNVTKEVALASEKGKTIIPIEVAQCQLNPAMEYALAGVHKVAYADEAALDRSLAKIGLLAFKTAAGPSTVAMQLPPKTTSQDDETMTRVAVLPFEDLSPDHDNEWFSDGLADELITTLNKLDSLFVLDRKSSKVYKDAQMTVRQIANELSVRYVITGAVRKAGDKLRIHATLVDASTGSTIWDEKFSGTMEDIFEIQEKTAFDICEGLKLKLSPAEEQLIEEKLIRSPEVFQLLMEARVKANVESKFEAAVEILERALAIEPDCLPVLHFISITYSNLHREPGSKSRNWFELERSVVERIMKIDPTSYYSYGPRANYFLNRGEKILALEMARKMVELQPKKWTSYAVLAFIATHLEDTRTLLFAYEECLKIDPSSVREIPHMMKAYDRIGERAKIAALWQHAKPQFFARVATYPDTDKLRFDLMESALIAGDQESCLAQLNYYLALPELSSYQKYMIAAMLCLSGRIAEARTLLRAALDEGGMQVAEPDIEWFTALRGSPEYARVVELAS